ncbi:MAG: isoprenylcysteine carboxylmethyltransferase family protein [Candidatus Neomarinimicrobiota bacterium]
MTLLNWFQLIVLILFYTIFLGRTVLLYRRGERVLVLGRGKTGLAGMRELVFIPGLALWSLAVLTRSLGRSGTGVADWLAADLHCNYLIQIIGVGLITGGLGIFILALIAFRNSWRIGIDREAPGVLVTDGIFAVCRNPVFLFMDLYFIGTWLIYPNWFFLACAIVFTLGIHWQIRDEEWFLSDHYGAEYRRYLETTPRYLF